MNAIDVTCPTCDAQPGDECRDDQGTFRIDGWPFFHRDRIIAAHAEKPHPLVGLWRAMSGAAVEAARAAEERTAAIDPGREPAPVVSDEPVATFVFPPKAVKPC